MNTITFNKDFANKTITVNCKLNAPLNIVWDAFTNASTMEKWFAPEPFRAITKVADFREGGRWLYYMLSPEGEKYWSFADYKRIEPMISFEVADGFCDENGTINAGFPQLYWRHTFAEENGATTVDITITATSEADIRQILEMGFEEGYKMGLNQLIKLLEE